MTRIYAHHRMDVIAWSMLLAVALTTSACQRTADKIDRATEAGTAATDSPREDSVPKEVPDMMEAEQRDFEKQRLGMVDHQLKRREITNPRVLQAMSRVPRHLFVPDDVRDLSYSDSPLPIGHGQTISQPLIVALMTQLVDPQPTEKALDIGTGSGYQAAVLAELVGSVYSIEIVEPLARQAGERLRQLGYQNVHVRHGDGYRGWPEQAPFDIILVAAAPDHVPQELIKQLAPGGKMVIPVGEYFQNLLSIEKSADGSLTEKTVAPVAFVPMTGEAEAEDR